MMSGNLQARHCCGPQTGPALPCAVVLADDFVQIGDI